MRKKKGQNKYGLNRLQDDALMKADGPQGRGPALRKGMRVTLKGDLIGPEDGTFQYRELCGKVVQKFRHGRFVLVKLDLGYCTTVRIDKQGRMLE